MERGDRERRTRNLSLSLSAAAGRAWGGRGRFCVLLSLSAVEEGRFGSFSSLSLRSFLCPLGQSASRSCLSQRLASDAASECARKRATRGTSNSFDAFFSNEKALDVFVERSHSPPSLLSFSLAASLSLSVARLRRCLCALSLSLLLRAQAGRKKERGRDTREPKRLRSLCFFTSIEARVENEAGTALLPASLLRKFRVVGD